MEHTNQNDSITDENKYLIFFAKIFALIGFFLFIFYLFGLWDDFSVFSCNKIDVAATGQFGDYIGGVVGTIFSFVGVLLFYNTLLIQRKELSETRRQVNLQYEEMKRQTSEFEINRITSLIYKQLEIFNLNLNNLSINLVINNFGIQEDIRFIGLQYIKKYNSTLPKVSENTEFIEYRDQQKVEFFNFEKEFNSYNFSVFLSNFESTLNLILNIINIESFEDKERELLKKQTLELFHANFYLTDLRKFYETLIEFNKFRMSRFRNKYKREGDDYAQVMINLKNVFSQLEKIDIFLGNN